MQAATAALAALAGGGREGGAGAASPSDLADLLGVASNVLRERGRLASSAGTGPQAVAAAAVEAAALEASFFVFTFIFSPGGVGFERGKRKLENRTRSSLLPVLSSPTAHPNDQNRTSSEPSSPPLAAAWPRESRPSSSSPTFSSRWPP